MGKEPTSNAVLEDFPAELQGQAAAALETERLSVEKGIDAWKKIVAAAPSAWEPRRELARVYRRAERWKACVEVLKEAVEKATWPAPEAKVQVNLLPQRVAVTIVLGRIQQATCWPRYEIARAWHRRLVDCRSPAFPLSPANAPCHRLPSTNRRPEPSPRLACGPRWSRGQLGPPPRAIEEREAERGVG